MDGIERRTDENGGVIASEIFHGVSHVRIRFLCLGKIEGTFAPRHEGWV